MEPVDRVLGALQESTKATLKRLDVIEDKVDRIREAHWKLAGKITGASVIITLLITTIIEFIRGQ